MNEAEEAAEAAYQNLKPQVEGSQSQKAAFILGFLQGWNGGKDAEMRSLYEIPGHFDVDPSTGEMDGHSVSERSATVL